MHWSLLWVPPVHRYGWLHLHHLPRSVFYRKFYVLTNTNKTHTSDISVVLPHSCPWPIWRLSVDVIFPSPFLLCYSVSYWFSPSPFFMPNCLHVLLCHTLLFLHLVSPQTFISILQDAQQLSNQCCRCSILTPKTSENRSSRSVEYWLHVSNTLITCCGLVDLLSGRNPNPNTFIKSV